MNLLDALTSLDLSKNEAQVYQALLKLGNVNAGPIVKETKLHRQFVYLALDSLEAKGLVTHLIRRNRKAFNASHPNTLVKMQKEREKLARDAIPHLLKLQPDQKERLEIRVLYGKEEFYKNLITTVESAARCDKCIRIIGGASDAVFYNLLGGLYQDYTDKCRQLKVKKLLLAPTNSSAQFSRSFATDPSNKLRMLDTGLSSPSYTRITEELTTIEIYATDVMIIQIFNPVVAAGYLEHFNLLWKAGRAFKPGK
jgi:sugar-specific transcriptional regulator TrmB